MYLKDLHNITGFFYSMHPYSSAFGMYAEVLVILTDCVVDIFEVELKVVATKIIFRFGF